MNYQQIEVFLAIIDFGGMSQAAEQLFTTQSSISKQLKNLEEEIGVKLLYREKGIRHVHLTPDGERFYPIAKEYQTAHQRIEQFKDSELRDTLKVASIDSLNTSVLNNLYPEILKRMNRLKLIITTNQTDYIYDMINRQDFDIGFVLSEYRWPNVVVKPFIRQNFKLLIYSEHPMDVSRKISPEELNPNKEIFQPWGPTYLVWHEYWWPQKQYQVKIDTVSMMKIELFREGSWTIVPDSVATLYARSPLFHIFDMESAPPARQCYYIKNRYLGGRRTRAIEEFEAVLEEYKREMRITDEGE